MGQLPKYDTILESIRTGMKAKVNKGRIFLEIRDDTKDTCRMGKPIKSTLEI